jgi:hypothetical protein
MDSRTATAGVGFLGSLLISVLAWWYFDTLLVFLLVPFVPILFRGGSTPRRRRRCPTCGFTTRNADFGYCPRDGTPLE